jgi:hypothetical protein
MVRPALPFSTCPRYSSVEPAPGNIMSNKIGAKIAIELKQLLQISLYMYICVGALLLYRMSILGAHDVEPVHYGYAAVKALLLAKFILLGHWLHLGEGNRNRLLIYSVLYQALAIWGFPIVLSVLEELLLALAHGHSIAGTVELKWNFLSQILAQSLILFLVLLPYIALRQLGGIMGRGELKQIFFAARTGAQAPPGL